MSAHSPYEQEQCVLCAALNEVEAWRTVTAALTPRDFHDLRHQAIFAALRSVTPVGRRPDVLAVYVTLRATGCDEDLIGYVGELIDATPTFDPLSNWIAVVLDGSRRRRTTAALTVAQQAIDEEQSVDDVERDLERTLSAIRSSAPDNRVFDDKALMAGAALAYLTDDAARTGTPYGFAAWDRAVLPAQPGHLLLLGGASGSGKSTVARNLIRSWAFQQKRRVGWLSCEMTGEEQLVHLACIDAKIPIEDYYRRRLTQDQAQAFAMCLEWWRDSDLLRINEMGAVTPERMLSVFRRWREQGIDHFMLDHLHRLDFGASKSGDDLRLPISACARSLKNFAKDSQAVVGALVQYSKIKPHEEPGDEKIRESNTILEEGDAVFHIYRPLVACEHDGNGLSRPIIKGVNGRYFDGDPAPKGAHMAHDCTAVYVKLGKQRRRLGDGLVRIPFDSGLAQLYDAGRDAGVRHAATAHRIERPTIDADMLVFDGVSIPTGAPAVRQTA